MKRNCLKLKSKIVDISEFKPNWSIQNTMITKEKTVHVSKEEIIKLSHLTRINFDEKEIELIQKDIEDIVNWFNKIKTVNTEGIEPLYTPLQQYEESNCLRNSRDDVVTEGNIQRETLSLTNLKKGNFYKVPKVIQED